MLKLTYSFSRYLRLTCESVYSRIHVVHNTSINKGRHFCTKNQNKILKYLCPVGNIEQTRLYANYKKWNAKRLNVFINKKTMSDPIQPTPNHVSCGGNFQIDESNLEISQYLKKSNEGSATKSSSKSEIPSDFRIWETIHKRGDTSDGLSIKFKLVSYNVLAQYLLECHPHLYTDCSPYDLKWKVRSSRLYKEILSLDPNILCLQEVQANHMVSFYNQFESIGYYGVYKQKTGCRNDGCAIYFKRSEFQLVDQVTIEYYQPGMPILNRDNIGLMVKLVPKCAPESAFVVATTHLLYTPQRTDVRLAQLQVLLAELDRFAFYNNGIECGQLPIILTGDFNSTPDSPVIKLLDNGHISAGVFRDRSDWRRIGVTDNCQHLSVYLSRYMGGHPINYLGLRIFNSDYCQNPPNQVEIPPNYNEFFNSGVLGHSLRLSSVYNRVKSDGQYEASTFQDFWVTVDYIYFSCYSKLSVLERLRLPTANECEVLGRLPNQVYASDHLALGALFELKLR